MLARAVQKDENNEHVHLKVEGLAAIVAYVLNGIVGLGGILLFILGIVARNRADDLCKNPAGCEDTWATIALIAGGFFLFVRCPAAMSLYTHTVPSPPPSHHAARIAIVVIHAGWGGRERWCLQSSGSSSPTARC